MFYIPAGTVHAIGKGILLAEVQQTSDITYRIYDWNRPGLDGKPRPLHTDLAREAVRFDLRPRRHKEPVLQTPYFVIKKEQWTEAKKINTRQPLIVQNTGNGTFYINGQPLSKGRTLLLWPGYYETGITEPGEVLLTSLPTTV
jgi:mannose-6-phosphate isomerase class I